ncbi:MAG TPA: PBP1A family penicillin-binding protein [Xanthobacteraceae bacterium]|nr:PBP1A family penicillin-binding protein [Xanthobacteraceae bacterium]
MGRRKTTTRREPVFDKAAALFDLRLRPEDRAGGGGRDPAPRKKSAQGAKPKSSSKRGNGRGGGRGLLTRLVYWALVLCLWAGVAGIGGVVWIGAHLPPIQNLEIPKRPPSIKILGTDGHVLLTRGDLGSAVVPLSAMPPYLPKAIVAIEDRRFYSHFGIDPFGIARAAIANILHRGVSQGGSTLTQQLAKNLFLTQERTFARKMQEAVLAVWLEHKFTKKQILELYLNRVYFGSGAYGVEAASQRYFGKSVRQITLAEAAMLAGLVKSPSRLSPLRNPKLARERADLVVAAMEDEHYITKPMAQAAIAHPATAVTTAGSGSANYAADWIMDVIDDLIGRVEQDIVVKTTIDPKIQNLAEASLVDELNAKGKKYNVGQGAVVVMTPEGAVRALVGGRNYAQSQFNRAVSAKRQPGSAFKPFVYLTALEHGLTPDTLRDDKPINVRGWKPGNFEHEYQGPVTLTRALAQSLNTVSVRLTLELGPATVARTAYRLGISSKLEPNASLALGTSEVSPLELVGAYAPFANGGLAVEPHVVESITDANGKSLYARKDRTLGRVVAAQYVAMMNMMMMETLLTGTAHNAHFEGWPAAGKTGTSQDFRDAWFVGYTSHLVTGVWLGNDDSSPMKKTTGGSLPVEIWSRVMTGAHQGVPVTALPGLGGSGSGGPLFGAPSGDVPVSSNNPYGSTVGGGGRYAGQGSLVPPGDIPNAAPARVAAHPSRQPARSGIDDWLINRLFGR